MINPREGKTTDEGKIPQQIRERRRHRRQNALTRFFFAYRYDRVDRFLRRGRLGDDSDASKLGGGERKHFLYSTCDDDDDNLSDDDDDDDA